MRIVAIGLLISACFVTVPLAWSGVAVHHNGKIAYLSGTEVDVVDASGLNARPLVGECSSPGCDAARELAWSPKGRKLAFVRGHWGANTPSKIALFVVNVNGRQLRRLMGCGDCGFSSGSSISWSPDGSRIVVTDGRRLALVHVETRLNRLVGPRCAVGSDLNPAWSPDGTKIAFGCGASLYVAAQTGKQAHVIATVPRNVTVGHPSWSPDGNELVFDAPDSIFTVRADGSHLTRVLAGQKGSGPGVPAWSPDGTRIVYFNTPGTPGSFLAEVWVMNADGSQEQRLYRSDHPVSDWAAPMWSPDGKRIAFSADAARGLMVMHTDGTGLHRIAPPVDAFAWQPLP